MAPNTGKLNERTQIFLKRTELKWKARKGKNYKVQNERKLFKAPVGELFAVGQMNQICTYGDGATNSGAEPQKQQS